MTITKSRSAIERGCMGDYGRALTGDEVLTLYNHR